MSARQAGWAIFVVCLAFRLAYLGMAHPPRPMGLKGEPQRVALSLIESGRFANPYAVETGDTAHLPPIQPALLAVILRVFGEGEKAERAKQSINVTLAAARAAMMPALAASLGLAPGAGILAGIVSIWPAAHTETDTPFDAPLTSLLLVCAVRASAGARRPSRKRDLLLEGGLWGFVCLSNPSCATVGAAVAAVEIWRRREMRGKAALRELGIALVAVLVVTGPWMARNQMAFGTALSLRNNLGLELAVSNRDGAEVYSSENLRRAKHPNVDREEALRVRAMGEAAYQKAKLKVAIEWIESNPGRFMRLTAARAWAFWFPVDADRSYRYPVWAVTAVGMAGLALLWRRRHPAALPLTAILAVYPLVFYVLQADMRYRAPSYAFSILAASIVFEELRDSVIRRMNWGWRR